MRDVALAVLRGKQPQLAADLVGDWVVDLTAEEDDALAQQPLVDRVVEVHAAGARGARVRAREDQIAHTATLTRSGYKRRAWSGLFAEGEVAIPPARRRF